MAAVCLPGCPPPAGRTLGRALPLLLILVLLVAPPASWAGPVSGIARDPSGIGSVLPGGLWLSGDLTLSGDVPEGRPAFGEIDDLRLLARFERFSRLAFFGELRFEDLVEVIAGEGIVTRNAEAVVERLYAEALITPQLSLRLGKIFTPFGLWNVISRAPTDLDRRGACRHRDGDRISGTRHRPQPALPGDVARVERRRHRLWPCPGRDQDPQEPRFGVGAPVRRAGGRRSQCRSRLRVARAECGRIQELRPSLRLWAAYALSRRLPLDDRTLTRLAGYLNDGLPDLRERVRWSFLAQGRLSDQALEVVREQDPGFADQLRRGPHADTRTASR